MNKVLLDFINPSGPVISRVVCFFGFLTCSALIFLGAVWPSVYTFVAIATIPAPFLFGFGIFKPEFIYNRRRLNLYLIYSTIAAILCVGYQIIFMLSHGKWN